MGAGTAISFHRQSLSHLAQGPGLAAPSQTASKADRQAGRQAGSIAPRTAVGHLLARIFHPFPIFHSRRDEQQAVVVVMMVVVAVVAAAATAAAEGLMKLLFLLFSAQAGIFRVVFFPPATWQARPAWEPRARPELNAWTLFLLSFHTFIYLAFFNSINHCSYECGPIHLQSATINFNSLASRPWGNMTCLCPLRMCLLWTCFVLPVKCNALNESQGWSEYILLSATKRYYIHVQEVGMGVFCYRLPRSC